MTPNPRHSLGRAAEVVARCWLEKQGLLPVVENWRGRRGELDLVMREGEVVVIVEVRARPRRTHEEVRASVDRAKARRFAAAAREYLWAAGLGDRLPVRGDLLTVVGSPDQPDIRWWRNALRLGL